MTEDDIYRTSTQYKLWSYTLETLASLRASTNSRAAARVKDAIRRVRAEKARGKDASQQDVTSSDVDCLTVDEEQKLVGFYCIKAMDLGEFCDFPTNVKATAVQYLKRFYLSNSPMTYHPKQMMPSALYLSTKTESNYTSLPKFVAKLPKTTAEDVIAPEFLLTQGLRFTFDVRHPQRGLEGIYMELVAMSTGTHQSPPGSNASPNSLQQDMIQLEPAATGASKAKSPSDLLPRIEKALHGQVKDILRTSALLTDAYFLFTPAQILLSAFLMADEPLARFYLSLKFPASSGVPSKLMATLRACIAILTSSPSVKPGQIELEELRRIDKKLYKCRNPEKMDLVGINKAQKRDGDGKSDGVLDEKIIKKRKLERESELKEDDMFGPSISK